MDYYTVGYTGFGYNGPWAQYNPYYERNIHFSEEQTIRQAYFVSIILCI